MKATITIDMDNAAFDDSKEGELSRILRDLACDILSADFTNEYDRKLGLYDVNGNSVGTFKITRS